MENLIKVIFIIINWSGIIGGIWLLFLGAWKLVVWSIIFLCLSKYIIAPLCLIPVLPAILISKIKNKLIQGLLIPICAIGHPLAVAIYGTLVIHLFYYRYIGQIPSDPLWLLVLGLGTSPWQWFASKEKTESAYATAFVSELVFFLVCLILIFIQPKLSFIFLMLFIGQLLHTLATLWMHRSGKKDSHNGTTKRKKIKKGET
ncbi:MAG: hypothetical protein PHI50_04485 [Alphaproteobacteria bacterium]|nr:hypothetical protein [Alphaproteobacteria bacterium]